MSFAEILGILKDLCIAGAAITTAYIAYTGIEKWKSELKGKAEFDAARNLIKSAYKLRDEVEQCRRPFIVAGAFAKSQGKNDPDEDGKAWANIYEGRWEPVAAAIQEFEVAALEAEALWGKGIKEKSTVILQLVRMLRAAIHGLIRSKYTGGESFRNRDFADQMLAITGQAPSSKAEEFRQDLEAAVKALEGDIRPHLGRC